MVFSTDIEPSLIHRSPIPDELLCKVLSFMDNFNSPRRTLTMNAGISNSKSRKALASD